MNRTYETSGNELIIQTATVAILDKNGKAIVANSNKLGLGKHSKIELPGVLTGLSTTAIWTCAAFTIRQTDMKMLLHAYEPYDILYSLKLLKESGFKISKNALFDLYLNPLQTKHHRGYKWNLFWGGVNMLKVKTHNVRENHKITI